MAFGVTVLRTVDESQFPLDEDEGFLRVTLSKRDLIGFLISHTDTQICTNERTP